MFPLHAFPQHALVAGLLRVSRGELWLRRCLAMAAGGDLSPRRLPRPVKARMLCTSINRDKAIRFAQHFEPRTDPEPAGMEACGDVASPAIAEPPPRPE